MKLREQNDFSYPAKGSEKRKHVVTVWFLKGRHPEAVEKGYHFVARTWRNDEEVDNLDSQAVGWRVVGIEPRQAQCTTVGSLPDLEEPIARQI